MTPEVWCTLKRAEAMVGGSPSDIELIAEGELSDAKGACPLTELNGTCPLATTCVQGGGGACASSARAKGWVCAAPGWLWMAHERTA
eukprot:1698865-Prymnesium_polylepis.1